MTGKNVLGAVVVIVAAAGLTLLSQAILAAEHASPDEKVKVANGTDKKTAVEVVLEEVDLSTNTITARATTYVVPPHGRVGGAVFTTGTTDVQNGKETKFVRLPVMPEANIKSKKLNAGLHVILQLEMIPQGALVVVGIEQFRGLERIGVTFLDAPGTKGGE